jgi:uncharacterized membrane protein YkoI
MKKTLIVIGAVAVLGGGAAIATAAGGDEDANETDVAISGSALDKASKAALGHTGGGKVTGTEVDDEEGKYEVEVTKDGNSVDVHLDEGFNVIGDEADSQEDE